MNINELRLIPLFAYVSEDNLIKLFNANEIVVGHYAKNTMLYVSGTECVQMDVVLSGKLISYSLLQNGSENILFEFEAASLIATNLLFSERNCYPFNIYCKTDCTLLHISKSAVLAMLKDDGFILPFIHSLSRHSQGMNQKIMMSTGRTLRENLLDYLKTLSERQNSTTITLPISKKQLADYLGVQRPSLFRVIKELTNEGLIEVHLNKIKLIS